MQRTPPPRATITVSGLFLGGLLMGTWAGRAAVARATDPYAGLDRFARMLTHIETDYVEPRDGEDLIDAAVKGMVDELDPHSRWMSARAVAALEADSEGSATGFGLEVGNGARGVVVLKVLAGSPAERDGIEPGDRILAIDGQVLEGVESDEVRRLFGGARGERAELEVLREGWEQPQVVRTLRDQVHIPATESGLLAGDVMYVRLIDFQHQSAEELADDVATLQAEATQKWAGLVLDLRDNTGGLLDEAVAIADLFLDEGLIVSVRGRRDGIESYRATEGGLPPEMPVVVLINGLSASASEIVAGALQDTERATLVGSETYGKGSVQQLYRNPDGSALKLTIALYHTPSGKPIEARVGRVPDVRVTTGSDAGPRARLERRLASLELDDAERDSLLALVAQLDENREELHRMNWAGDLEARLARDPVVQRALEVLDHKEGAKPTTP